MTTNVTPIYPNPPELSDLAVPEGLRLREPTGAVTFPFVLLEGEEKAGKTYAACAFAASPRVGHVFALDLGEGTLDEYAPLGAYNIIEHNGTYMDLVTQLELALAIPSDPRRPNVVIIDPISNLWKLIVRWLDGRARSSRANQNKLKADPDAEIVITQNLWNDGKARWRRVVDQLMTYPGIVVVTARGKEVSEVDSDGNPTKNKVWSVETEKSLTWDVTAWVRFERGQDPRLIAVRSLAVDVPQRGVTLPRDNMMEHLVFDTLGAGAQFTARDTNIPTVGVNVTDAKKRVLAFLDQQGVKPTLAKQQAGAAWKACKLDGRPEVTEDDIEAVYAWLREANVGDWNKPPADAATDDEHDATVKAEAAEAPNMVDNFLGATQGSAGEVDASAARARDASPGLDTPAPAERVMSDTERAAHESLAAAKGEPTPLFCAAGDGVIDPEDYVEGEDGRDWHVNCFPEAPTDVVEDEPPM